jgi:Thioesterase-like superfamily
MHLPRSRTSPRAPRSAALTHAATAGYVAPVPPEATPADADIDDFSLATRVVPTGDPGQFRAEVPEGWQQGRGAFGGLVLGALARAMAASEPEPDRTLRSLTAELFAPVLVGPAEVRVETLRRGSGVSSYDARIAQGGELLARASATFGRPRRDRRRWSPPDPPPARAWGEAPVLDVRPPLGPPFARFFEYRPTGPAIFGGGSEAITSGWVRPRRPLASFGGPELVALADAWWPATFSIDSAPRPAATLSYAIEFSWDGTPLPADQPLFYRARAVAACDGFVVEMRELWTLEGQALAFNQQTFVLI